MILKELRQSRWEFLRSQIVTLKKSLADLKITNCDLESDLASRG